MPKRKRSVSIVEEIEDEFEEELDSKTGLPVQRNAANARERARMRVLSSAFYRLKTIIPWVPRDTKLSKLDTLRLATNYINFLASTLDGESTNEVGRNMAQTQKLTWPFIFQQMHDASKQRSPSNATRGNKAEINDGKWNIDQMDVNFTNVSPPHSLMYKSELAYTNPHINYCSSNMSSD